MGFTNDTAREAGKKSRRGKDKQTKIIRECLSDTFLLNQENINRWFQEVADKDPAKALELLLKLSSLVVPKPRNNTSETNCSSMGSVNVKIIKPDSTG